MRHLFPFLGALAGGFIGTFAFPGSAPGNQVLFALLGAGGIFLVAGFCAWVLPALPRPTPEEIQYRGWVASWTPPPPPHQVYQEDPYVQHQRHLQDQARMGWLMGDKNYPPTDWFGR